MYIIQYHKYYISRAYCVYNNSYNVKLGLIIPAVLINPLCQKKM